MYTISIVVNILSPRQRNAASESNRQVPRNTIDSPSFVGKFSANVYQTIAK